MQYYEWAGGSQPGSTDLFDWTVTDSETSSEYNLATPLTEGEVRLDALFVFCGRLITQTIYVALRAYNGAGLYATAFSSGLAIDFSAPVVGYVHDGPYYNTTTTAIDIDYQVSPRVFSTTSANIAQTQRDQISANWGGFSDPQSNISSYVWGAGTEPGLDNVVAFANVGLATTATTIGLTMHDGLVVYVTLIVCNHANLCVETYSDGVMVDGSAPVPGVVKDGLAGVDLVFSAMPSTFALNWFGFHDPQSPIVSPYLPCI